MFVKLFDISHYIDNEKITKMKLNEFYKFVASQFNIINKSFKLIFEDITISDMSIIFLMMDDSIIDIIIDSLTPDELFLKHNDIPLKIESMMNTTLEVLTKLIDVDRYNKLNRKLHDGSYLDFKYYNIMKKHEYYVSVLDNIDNTKPKSIHMILQIAIEYNDYSLIYYISHKFTHSINPYTILENAVTREMNDEIINALNPEYIDNKSLISIFNKYKNLNNTRIINFMMTKFDMNNLLTNSGF